MTTARFERAVVMVSRKFEIRGLIRTIAKDLSVIQLY